MLEGFRYRSWLRRAQADRRKLRRKYRRKIIDARSANKSPDDIGMLEAEEIMECDLIDDEIAGRQTGFLLEQARRHLLPIPEIVLYANQEEGPDWVRSRVTSGYHLTGTASQELKAKIAEAEELEWKRWTRWTPILSAITGLLGTVIAIMALFIKASGH